MNKKPELIVMLTQNDYTLRNAAEVFETCKDSKARYWGFKEAPLSREEMKKIFHRMKECGKTTILEVVSYSEEGGLQGAETAVECGCDILLGTIYTEKIAEYCREHDLKYMPFAGEVSQRPSVLEGNIDDIISQAEDYLKKGVYGIDLLGYRYTGDATLLNSKMVSELKAPVCIAGGIDSYRKLDEVKEAGPEFFTIGSAFFENRFGGSVAEQIDKVCDYISGESA